MRRHGWIEVCGPRHQERANTRLRARILKSWVEQSSQEILVGLKKSGILPTAAVLPMLPSLPSVPTLAQYRSGPPPVLRLEVGEGQTETVMASVLDFLGESSSNSNSEGAKPTRSPVFELPGFPGGEDDGVLTPADLPWVGVGNRLRSEKWGRCRILRVEDLGKRFVLESESGESFLQRGEELIRDFVLDLDQRMSRIPVALELSVRVDTEAR